MIWNDRMRRLREDSDITLEEIAGRIGVAISTAQRYEKSDGIKAVPYEAITKYAEIFDVSPSYIMGWQDDKGSYSKPISTKTYPGCKGFTELIDDIYKIPPDKRELAIEMLRRLLAYQTELSKDGTKEK